MKNMVLYQQRKAVQLCILTDNFRKLKTKASNASIKIQLEMNYSFTWIGFLIDENKDQNVAFGRLE